MLAALRWGVGYVLTWIVAVLANGLLISATWGWFISPITGAREITVAEGVGLSLFVSIVGSVATAHLAKPNLGDDNEPGQLAARGLWFLITNGVIVPLSTLAVAWAWRTFAMGPISN